MSFKLYDERDPEELEPYFGMHMSAMTEENLFSKAEIAMELAHRDCRIAELEAEVEALRADRERLAMEKDVVTIKVFHEEPDNTFICAINGCVTVRDIERIEENVLDVLDGGDGMYTIKCTYEPASFTDGGLSQGDDWMLEVFNRQAIDAARGEHGNNSAARARLEGKDE